MQRRLIIFSLLALLTGCAVQDEIKVTEQPVLMPMAPPLGSARRVVQQITALWPGRQETLLCVLELDSQRIAMAGLSNDGLSLFNLTYDGKTINVDKSPLLPDSVAPEYMITDLQLVYWPIAELQKILPAQWRLEADKNHRRLYYKGENRVDVDYSQPDAVWPKTVDLVNHQYNYRLHIKTISYEAVPE